MRLALLLAALTASPSLHTQPGEDLNIRFGDRVAFARVAEGEVQGPSVQIRVTGTEIRGAIGRLPVDLVREGTLVRGAVGAGPARLHVTRDGVSYRIEGMLQGDRVRLTVDAQRLEGQLGECGFELKVEKGEYVGRGSCPGGLPERAYVRVPASLLGRPDPEWGAILAMMMLHGTQGFR